MENIRDPDDIVIEEESLLRSGVPAVRALSAGEIAERLILFQNRVFR